MAGYVASRSAETTSSALTISRPVGVAVGDLLVAVIKDGTQFGVTVSQGWTEKGNFWNPDGTYGWVNARVYTRYATLTADDSITTSASQSGYWRRGVVVAYRGISEVGPLAYQGGSQQSTIVAPSVTLTKANAIVLACFAWTSSNVPAAPSGTTSRFSAADQFHITEFQKATTGTSGTRYSYNGAAVGSVLGFQLALYPANQPPTAPTWVTPQNAAIPVDADFDLDWDSHDPDPGDSQSEYVLDRWTLDGPGGARVAGSLLRVTAATPNTWRRITAGTLAVGAYEYKVATRDSQGAPTDPAQLVFSESLFVTAAESPDPPTFVTPGPIAGETISTSSREYVISAPDVDASEWTLYADNNGTIDTSTILAGPVLKETGDLRRHTFTGLANNTPVWVSVEIKDGGLWSQPTQQRNPVAYSPPPAPTYTLLEDPAEGEIVVQINNPAPGTGEVATSYNEVFITDPGKPEQRRATEIPANGAWTYQLPPSGFDGVTTGVVRVEAVADNGTRTSSA